MRIIKPAALEEFWKKYPKSKPSLSNWFKIAKIAKWKHLADVRTHFPATDAVKMKSGSMVTIFNISGNAYRLIVAIHYNREIVYLLRFLTHADYSKESWKNDL